MKIKDFDKYLKEIEPRTNFLRENGYYLESFLVLCGVLEKELITLIEFYDM